jgi:hypothetical protein
VKNSLERINQTLDNLHVVLSSEMCLIHVTYHKDGENKDAHSPHKKSKSKCSPTSPLLDKSSGEQQQTISTFEKYRERLHNPNWLAIRQKYSIIITQVPS